MLILDTHVWWWALSEPDQLSEAASQAIDSAPRDKIGISAISLWELSLLISRQKITSTLSPDEWIEAALQRVHLFSLTPAITLGAYRLPGEFHRDPADRLIVSTARNLGATLVTKDRAILEYPFVKTIW